MKKFISALIAIILIITPLSVSATENTDPTKIKMGDVNLDGSISASDARQTLRCAAKLDPSDNISMLSIDADGDNKITASDARCILRVSAKLSDFANGFDGEGNPCALNVIHSNVYHIDVENYDEAAKASIRFELARKNDDIYMISSDESMMNNFGMGEDNPLNISKCGMMISDGMIYALMGTKSNKEIAMAIPEELQAELKMDSAILNEIVDMVSTLIPENIGTPTLTELNGQKTYCYTYTAENQQCQLYLSESGSLMHINGIMNNGDVQTLLTFNSVSADTPNGYFDLSSFDELW